jgi:hypothetical protein
MGVLLPDLTAFSEEVLMWNDWCVLRLAKRMRTARDASVGPILADALEDAGYNDQKYLTVLRTNSCGEDCLSILIELITDGEYLQPCHAWYSSKMARLGGHAVYRQGDITVHVTEIRNVANGDMPFNNWDDNVYLGLVRMKDGMKCESRDFELREYDD